MEGWASPGGRGAETLEALLERGSTGPKAQPTRRATLLAHGLETDGAAAPGGCLTLFFGKPWDP